MDCSSFVKLEKCCRIDLSQLTLSRSESPFDSESWRLCRQISGTAAEELVACVELSVDLQSDLETDRGVVLIRD